MVTKLYCRECLRLCELSCLYYNVYDDETLQDKPQSTVEALHHLVQIRCVSRDMYCHGNGVSRDQISGVRNKTISSKYKS